jgi:hypothetical protein
MANKKVPGLTQGEIEKKLFESDEEDFEMDRFSDNEGTGTNVFWIRSHL